MFEVNRRLQEAVVEFHCLSRESPQSTVVLKAGLKAVQLHLNGTAQLHAAGHLFYTHLKDEVRGAD